MLPNGQVLYAGGGKVKYCGQYSCTEPIADAELYITDRVLVHRMRATAFSLLTPFYFLKAGSLVSLPAIAAGAGLIGAFLAVKVGATLVGVWPIARAFGIPTRDANYTTLLMSTGLTFGTIASERSRRDHGSSAS